MISDEIIIDAVSRLREAAPGATIILFGSHARGEAREGSDLDFMVVEPEVKARREEMVRLRRAVGRIGMPVDIIVVSRKNFEEWRNVPGSAIYRVAKDGIVLNSP